MKRLVRKVVAAVGKQVVLLEACVPIDDLLLKELHVLLVRHEGMTHLDDTQVGPHFRGHHVQDARLRDGHAELFRARGLAAENLAAIPILAVVDQQCAVESLDVESTEEQWPGPLSGTFGDVVEYQLDGLLPAAQSPSHELPKINLAVRVDVRHREQLILELAREGDIVRHAALRAELLEVGLDLFGCHEAVLILVPSLEFLDQLLEFVRVLLQLSVQVLAHVP
mmetsp:Transcript_90173/g.291481  ORF Transcript_90173/g.291481 Transcript_90173/m.291481 type:complete len:224 (-) Transcript_90173:392-1063(-)